VAVARRAELLPRDFGARGGRSLDGGVLLAEGGHLALGGLALLRDPRRRRERVRAVLARGVALEGANRLGGGGARELQPVELALRAPRRERRLADDPRLRVDRRADRVEPLRRRLLRAAVGLALALGAQPPERLLGVGRLAVELAEPPLLLVLLLARDEHRVLRRLLRLRQLGQLALRPRARDALVAHRPLRVRRDRRAVHARLAEGARIVGGRRLAVPHRRVVALALLLALVEQQHRDVLVVVRRRQQRVELGRRRVGRRLRVIWRRGVRLRRRRGGARSGWLLHGGAGAGAAQVVLRNAAQWNVRSVGSAISPRELLPRPRKATA
jgi:hypothetical protein